MRRSNLTAIHKNFNSTKIVVVALVIGVSLLGQGLSASLGKSTAYAQTTSDTTYRWGSFSLSKYDDHPSDIPLAISNLTNITAIAAGNASDMALDSSGNVWTWGDNNNGVLGDGSTTDQPFTAVKVSGLPTIVQIAESDNTDVALAANGTVWGWGWNEAGQLCTGNHKQHPSPIQLTNLSGVKSMAGAGEHILYLQTNGTLEACGSNKHDELGDGSTASSKVPVTVVGLPAPVESISASQVNSTALLSNGQVWDWGWNKFGELGNGNKGVSSNVPVQVQLPSAAAQVYTGGDAFTNGQALALLTNGQVWGWGNNAYGQLGNGKKKNASVPVQATSLPSGVTFTYVVSGGSHSLALDSNGNVWGWGNNDKGQVGNGSSSGSVLTPVQVLSGADMISATADDSVAHVPAQ